MKNKILTAVLSALIAFGLWMYVITVVSPGYEKTFYNIPVQIQNETVLAERGLIITKNSDPTVKLHLTGNRVDLNRLNSANITITVDASKIYEAREQNLSYSITYPGEITEDSISAQKTPNAISLTVEELVSKNLNVVVDYAGKVPEGFTCDKENADLSAEMVMVTGPKSVMDKIQSAKVRVDLKGQTQTISGDYPISLCDAEGKAVSYDPALMQMDLNNINLTVRIQRLKELSLKPTIVAGGGATEKTSKIKLSVESIWVSGPENLLEDMTEIALDPINLKTLTKTKNTVTLPVKLPAGITNESGEAEVQVEISFPELETKTFTVKKFTATNVPGGMRTTWITKSLKVTVRGPKAQIRALEKSDITASVDFSGEEAGSVSKNAVFSFGKYTGVGAVGTYNVKANLG